MKFAKFLAIILVIALLIPFTVMADVSETARVATENESLLAIMSNLQVDLDLRTRSAILMEASTGQILYEMNADEQLSPASVTKIMSLLLVVEAVDSGKIKLEDMVTTSAHAASMGGSQIWLEVNEQMSVDDLLKAACIASANDATVALGEHLAGSEESFVAMMNERATELGMTNTVFKNASGLDAEGHVTSARDVALMSQAILEHDIIKEYSSVWMDTLRGGETGLVNTNKLVRFYPGSTGLKTGTTSGAGHCLSATAERDGMELIAVVMGSENSDDRFNAARKLLDYGFANYQLVTIDISQEDLPQIPVKNGVDEFITFKPFDTPSVLAPKGKAEQIEKIVDLPEFLEAPVAVGQEVGFVRIMLGEEEIMRVSVYSSTDIAKMRLGNAIGILLRALFTP